MKLFDESITRRQALATLGLAAIASPLSVLAQSDRPITFILPVGPGSGVDTITRSAGAAMSKAFGHTVVIENKPGAGGIIGTSALVKAPADGYTLGMVSNNHVVYPSVYKTVPFDPIADITPISLIGSTPLLLVANPAKVQGKNLQAVIADMKARPDDYTYASSGNGTILHLAAAMFVDQAQVHVRHIPYKGVGPMTTDLIGGQVDLAVSSLPAVLPHLKSGALRALGVCGAKRLPSLPDVPTLAEQGLSNYECAGWFATVAPANLPEADTQRIYKALVAAFQDPAVQESMDKQGNTIQLLTPEKTAQFFRSELKKYADVARKSGIEKV